MHFDRQWLCTCVHTGTGLVAVGSLSLRSSTLQSSSALQLLSASDITASPATGSAFVVQGLLRSSGLWLWRVVCVRRVCAYVCVYKSRNSRAVSV